MTALLVATLTCALANAVIVVGKLTRAPFVVRNVAEVGVPPSWVPRLALLEGAGAVGLLVGLAGPALLGLAAAVGLAAFFVGAVTAHVRAHVLHSVAFPGIFLGLAVASAAYFATALA